MDGFMEQLSGWAFSVSVCCVICEIFNLISPDNRYKKTINIVLVLFFLLCFIAPFAGGVMNMNKIDFSTDENHLQNIDKTQEVLEQIKHSARKKIEKQIEEILNKNQITAEKITAFINTDDNNNIVIDKVQIVLKSQDIGKTTSVEKIILQNYFITPEIIHS